MKTQIYTSSSKETLQTRVSLLLRVKSGGDEQAWEEFAKIYEPFLKAFLMKKGLRGSDVEDVTQEFLLKLYQNIEKYHKQDGAKFRTWLVTVLKNTLFTHLRKNKTDRERDEKWAEEKLRELNSENLEKEYELEWQKNICDLAFANVEKKFSGKAIEVFTMTLNEVPVDDICEKLDLKRDSVYRLRGRVKKALSQEVDYLRSQME